MKEEKVTDTKLLDSSVVLAYLVDGLYKETIDDVEVIYLSSVSLFEIKKKLLQNGVPEQVVSNKISFIKKRFICLDLNEEISEFAATLSIKNNLPAMDSLIYATAQLNGSILITLDNDFRGLKETTILNLSN